jgi:iron complex transport system substrate-binding protein
VIFGSWCGKKYRPERVAARPGWNEVPAVNNGDLYEVKSADILQPGPAALTDGVRRIYSVLAEYTARRGSPASMPRAS